VVHSFSLGGTEKNRVIFKLATEDDIPALVKANIEIKKEYPDLYTIDNKSEKIETDYFHKTIVFPRIVVKCLLNGNIIGICRTDLDKDPNAMWISVNLLKKYTDMGIGRDAIVYIARHCKAHGFRKLHLYVNIQNQNAISLYQDMGFNTIKHVIPMNDKKYYEMVWHI
jgi:ribosomal protein S18 acetylase RimI-like enzyme